MPFWLTKILLSSTIMVSVPLVLLVSFIVIDEELNQKLETDFLLSNLVAGLFLVISWSALWRREIRWTLRRRTLYLLSLLWSLIPAFGVYLIVERAAHDELAIVLAGFCWDVVWVGSTILMWRETATERAERLHAVAIGAIACPSCGYNLTGLREARCPECGAQFTLDELLAYQSERAIGVTGESSQIRAEREDAAVSVAAAERTG
jgi:hypothetical protein